MPSHYNLMPLVVPEADGAADDAVVCPFALALPPNGEPPPFSGLRNGVVADDVADDDEPAATAAADSRSASW